MGKGAHYKEMKEKAKVKVEDLEVMLGYLQSARKESRPMDVSVLEGALRLLHDLKADLHHPSPASSLQAGSLGSFSSEINRLLRLGEEEDDASSALPASRPEHDLRKVADNDTSFFESFNVNQEPQRQEFPFTDFSKGSYSMSQNLDTASLLYPSEPDTASLLYPSEPEFHPSYDLRQEVEQNYPGCFGPLMYGEEASDQVSGYFLNMNPPPSAYLGPRCSYWECIRPAEDSVHYCSSDHAALASKGGPPGMRPVLRPGGIDLKEYRFFAVLNAKAESKDVGIPECEGAATAKSPWNAPELFDISVHEGETVREWLFFDKPRRAFENGNRKQRSLPDYNGRGWHESRKQVMNDHGGQKRSYYMDPQPRKDFEWHLYEYEIFNFHDCALYRLEFKRVSDKKSPKGKSVPNDSVADLQKQMGRLTADSPTGSKRSGKAKANASPKDGVENTLSVQNRVGPTNEGFGAVSDYLVADQDGYYFGLAEKT